MEKEVFEFPEVIKEAVKGLDHELRWKILELLIMDGNKSYMELMRDLNIDKKGRLTFHLGILTRSALIERFERLGNSRERSFYDITHFGRDLINALVEAMDPQPKPTSVYGDIRSRIVVMQDAKRVETETIHSSTQLSAESITVRI